MEVVFKVALVLLGNHKELVKQCDSFESIMEFLKSTLPGMGIIQMERVINQVNLTHSTKQPCRRLAWLMSWLQVILGHVIQRVIMVTGDPWTCNTMSCYGYR